MKTFVFFLCSGIILVIAPVHCEDDDEEDNSRIINGWRAQPGQFPWQVYLLSGSSECGGALISDEWVLTAAHCCTSMNLADYRLLLGTTRKDLYHEGVVRGVLQMIIYPTYNNQTLNNDAAVMRLQSPVEFSARIHPINLPNFGQVLRKGDSAWVSGWGLTADALLGGKASEHLMYTNLHVLDNRQCIGIFTILDNAVCVQGANGKSACNGDSGSPLVQQINEIWTHVGLVSGGLNCFSGFPSIYTRTESILNFIYKNTNLRS